MEEWVGIIHWITPKWPGISPDCNPIEQLWKELKLAAGKRHPSNLRELEPFAQAGQVRLQFEKKLI